jgi:pyruvate kinase
VLTEKPLRKTKIVATLGPSCNNLETLTAMINAGMNVARINFSHGTYAEHTARIQLIRQAAEEAGANIGILIDTKGMEIRTRLFKNNKVELRDGQTFTLYTDDRMGDETGVAISYVDLPKKIKIGERILLDDGAIRLKALKTTDTSIECLVEHGGALSNRKGINVPDTQLDLHGLDEVNRQDLIFAATQEIDFIAASFTQAASDITEIRELMKAHGKDVPIIAKIENKRGVDNLDEIIAAADGIMVARGDLGVELPVEVIPAMQKKIISSTVFNGKPVITATQMLDSMEDYPTPTRAEVSDVANAIFDGTSAVMLSGETAAGKHPVESVRMMASIAINAEMHIHQYGYLQNVLPDNPNIVTEAVCQGAATMAEHVHAAAIMCLTETGFTARMISKYRPRCAIIAITYCKEVVRRLSLNWGVYAILDEESETDEICIQYGIDQAKRDDLLKSNDIVLVTAGRSRQQGGTDMISVIKLP